MQRVRYHVAFVFPVALVVSGCATPRPTFIPPTPIMQAAEEIPEEQLLDVGIMAFEAPALTEKQADKEGTDEEIRKAESHFMAFHLKNTLQGTGHWGAVRVIPDASSSVDLYVTGTILESNGQRLNVRARAFDSTGKEWMEKTYKQVNNQKSYADKPPSQPEAFQGLYNRVANDLAELRRERSSEELRQVRLTTEMRFAADFSPAAFGSYVEKRGDRYRLRRFPAENDPMVKRLMKVRDREHMYVDTLDEYYEGFYQEMEPEYEEWRKYNLVEREAIQQIKGSAIKRVGLGVAMIAGAIALELFGVDNTGTLRDVLVLGGGAVIVGGINISKEAEIHKAGLKELSDSFSADIQTVVVEFEGKKVELTGTVQEQYQQWRDILRRMYQEDTGFGVEPDDVNDEVPATL